MLKLSKVSHKLNFYNSVIVILMKIKIKTLFLIHSTRCQMRYLVKKKQNPNLSKGMQFLSPSKDLVSII